MNKRFKVFSFATKNLAVFTALLPHLSRLGYSVDMVSKMPDSVVTGGVTLHGSFDGDVGIGYYIDKDAKYTRIEDLLVYLKSTI